MYLKVIVLEIKEDYCLAMTGDGEVIRIRKKKGIRVGEKIYVLQEDIYEKQAEEKKEHVLPFAGKNPRASIVRRIAAVAAIFAICFSAVFYLQPSKTVYAKVSVDGMSSIQLTVDEDFKVVDAVSYDATVPEEELEKLVGKKLLDLRPFLLDLKGDGTDAVIVAYGFLESESSDDESALKESLKELFGTKSNLYLRGSAEDVKAAEREAESLGIYIAKKRLQMISWMI